MTAATLCVTLRRRPILPDRFCEHEPQPLHSTYTKPPSVPHSEQDPLKDATPTADTGALMIEGAQAVRSSTAAANGGASSVENGNGNGHNHENTNDASAPLAPEDADRFAMAFRPSWEPLAPDAAPAPTRSRAPSVGPRVSSHPPAPAHDVIAGQDELLRLRGRRARKRSITLAAVSVLSFASLVYWGISTTTSGTEHAASRSLVPPPAAEPELAPTPEPAYVPAAPLPERTGLTARLADPSAPAVEPQATARAETEDQALPTEPAAVENAEQVAVAPEAPAQPSSSDQTAPQPPAAEAVGSDSPNRTTSIQPATAAEAQPVVAALQPAAAASPQANTAGPHGGDAQRTAPPATPAEIAKLAAASSPSAPAAVAKPPAAPPKPADAALAAAARAPAAATPAATANAPTAKAAAASAPAAAVVPAKPAAAAQATVAKAAPESAHAAATKPAEPATLAGPPLLVVRAVPDNAQLWLDGQKMPNPFDTRLPLGSKHKIEARQEGFEASSQTIRLESDARLTITLKRETPAPAPHIKVQPLPEGSRGAGFVTTNPY